MIRQVFEVLSERVNFVSEGLGKRIGGIRRNYFGDGQWEWDGLHLPL